MLQNKAKINIIIKYQYVKANIARIVQTCCYAIERFVHFLPSQLNETFSFYHCDRRQITS